MKRIRKLSDVTPGWPPTLRSARTTKQSGRDSVVTRQVAPTANWSKLSPRFSTPSVVIAKSISPKRIGKYLMNVIPKLPSCSMRRPTGWCHWRPAKSCAGSEAKPPGHEVFTGINDQTVLLSSNAIPKRGWRFSTGKYGGDPGRSISSDVLLAIELHNLESVFLPGLFQRPPSPCRRKHRLVRMVTCQRFAVHYMRRQVSPVVFD